jgi:osmoprotectant transport system permease protein
LFTEGFQKDFLTPVVVGVVLSLLLALLADLVLVGLQRVLTPWARVVKTVEVA